MGLLDKIKDNAKTISMKAIDATREYDEDYNQSGEIVSPNVETVEQVPEVVPEQDAEFMVDEAQETPASNTEDEKPKESEKSEKEEDKEDKPARKSKVTEVSKADHEKAEKEKRQEKAKQAAKERLAKTYTPSYKKDKDGKTIKAEVKEGKDAPKKPASRSVGIVDVAVSKFQTPAKSAAYAREKAALSALASQRKLNGTVPLYITKHMNFRTHVFINRIEYSGSFGKSVLPIEMVAWVKLRAGGTGVIIETTEGKRVVMVIKPSERLAFANAVMKVQALQPKRGKFKDTKTVRIDQLEKFNEGIDEIEKLAKLYDKGIISQEEFDAKKRQILGI